MIFDNMIYFYNTHTRSSEPKAWTCGDRVSRADAHCTRMWTACCSKSLPHPHFPHTDKPVQTHHPLKTLPPPLSPHSWPWAVHSWPWAALPALSPPTLPIGARTLGHPDTGGQ